METAPLGSTFLYNGFVVLTVLLAAGVVWNVYLAGRGVREPLRRTLLFTGVAAVSVALWLALTWAIASTGLLADFDRRPPPLVVMVVAVFAISITAAFTRYGTRFVAGLPLWVLVLGQAFRLPLEWLMHRAAEEGVMPPQMSYSGWNFDIVTGATAIPVAFVLARGFRYARPLAVVWNVAGSLLLLNVITIAIVSTPLIAAFGAARLNTWITHPPYVWLPTMMVVCAITGHLVIFRKLRATATRRL